MGLCKQENGPTQNRKEKSYHVYRDILYFLMAAVIFTL